MSIPNTSAATAVQALRTWLLGMGKAAGLTDAQVILAEQNLATNLPAPRPPLPYLSVRLVSQRATGEPEQVKDTDAGAPRLYSREPREALVSVQGYGQEADEWMERAMASRNQPSSQALLSTITVRPSGGVRNITAALEGVSYEHRSSMDVLVTYMRSTELLTPETPAELTVVEVEGTLQTLPIAETDPSALPITATYP